MKKTSNPQNPWRAFLRGRPEEEKTRILKAAVLLMLDKQHPNAVHDVKIAVATGYQANLVYTPDATSYLNRAFRELGEERRIIKEGHQLRLSFAGMLYVRETLAVQPNI